ncbi:hypothetical protein REPUB_Repub15cG0067700 [Reevesia pubescens]
MDDWGWKNGECMGGQMAERATPTSMKVANFISNSGKNKEEDVLTEIFWPGDVKLILRIPISTIPKFDILIWNETSTCMFTVKCAYHVTRRVLGQMREQDESHDMVWKLIWSASVATGQVIFVEDNLEYHSNCKESGAARIEN